jgi:hypothetical protein
MSGPNYVQSMLSASHKSTCRDEAKWGFGESPSLSRNLIRAKIDSCDVFKPL